MFSALKMQMVMFFGHKSIAILKESIEKNEKRNK